MIAARTPLPAVLLAAFSLSGCAGSVSTYPSLSPRPIEQGMAAPAPIADVGQPEPAALTQATELGAQAQRGEAAFAAAVRTGCAAVQRGRSAAEGSDAWVAAQQALSAIEAQREPTTAALDSLNTLVLDQARLAQEASRPVDLSALTQAAQTAGALEAAQSARLAALREEGCRP